MSQDLGVTARAMMLEASAEDAAHLRQALEDAGISVVEWSASGTGWIAAWQKSKPDLVVVDLQLPKRDGLYCLEKILSLDANAIVIFTHSYTGLLANDVEMKALAVGASSVLQKPYSVSRLRVSLQRAVDQIQKKRRSTYTRMP